MPSNPPSSISPSSNSSALPCATDASGTKVAHSSTPPRRSRSALSSTRAATTSTRIAHAPSAGSVLTRAAVGDRTSAAATCQRRSARIRSARALAAAARSAVVCGPAPLRVGGGGGGQTARCTNVRRASASAASIIVHRSRVTRYWSNVVLAPSDPPTVISYLHGLVRHISVRRRRHTDFDRTLDSLAPGRRSPGRVVERRASDCDNEPRVGPT